MYAGHVELTPDMPSRGDPDRKRALNVLAQRRYRQRKKERLKGALKHTDTAAVPTVEKDCEHAVKGFGLDSNDVGFVSLDDLASASTALTSTREDGFVHPSFTVPDAELASFNEIFNFSDQPQQELSLQSSLQELELAQFTFSDESAIDVPIFKLLNTGSTIAKLLGYDDSIWDPTTRSVLDRTFLHPGVLPKDFVPVGIQLTMPHSPLFDILPWPSVRIKLITVFSMPLQSRPPAARDAQAIMNMVYDIDDNAEGFRISGGDGMQSDHWEIGQAFFNNWWWALDRQVIQRSNALRALRGASPLMLESPEMPD